MARARKTRSKHRKQDRALVSRIDALIQPMGCRISGIGPSAVGVQGDARSYGISVVIQFPPDMTAERIGEVSNMITNHNREVSRVLMDLVPI